MVTLLLSDFNSQAYSLDNMIQLMKTFLFFSFIALKITWKSFKPVKLHKNMTNRFNRSRIGDTIVSIVLEIHKTEDDEIPPHFVHEIKTKSYYVIDAKVFASNKDSTLKRSIRSLLYY